jgi:hypothetical protein
MVERKFKKLPNIGQYWQIFFKFNNDSTFFVIGKWNLCSLFQKKKLNSSPGVDHAASVIHQNIQLLVLGGKFL